MRILCCFFILFSIPYRVKAQTSLDLVQINYLHSPSKKQLDYSNLSLKTNIPVKLKKAFLINSLSYSHSNIDYHIPYSFDVTELNHYQEIKHSITYSYPLQKSWRVSARFSTLLASNFVGSLTSDDFFWNGALITTRKKGTAKKGSSLTLGIAYVTLGKPQIVPVLKYQKTINEKLYYILGFPKTLVNYKIHPRQRMSIGLGIDGSYTNLSGQKNPLINDTMVKRVSFRSYYSEVEHTYKLTETWNLKSRIGYSFYNDYTLVSQNEKDLYQFNIKGRPTFSFQISYDLVALIKKKMNNKKTITKSP